MIVVEVVLWRRWVVFAGIESVVRCPNVLPNANTKYASSSLLLETGVPFIYFIYLTHEAMPSIYLFILFSQQKQRRHPEEICA
jgi:hypothetical protein